jgi:poly(A) polymerase
MPLPDEIVDRVLDTPHGTAAFQVVERFLDAGEECWWIGGSTRDMFLGKVPKEIDLTTSAKPSVIQSLFPKNDASAAALGAVVISHKGHSFEITTFREDDAASDGRHPESVRFGNRQADALRRDATVNAIYFNPISNQLFDPCNGESDLKERLVRFIGDPAVRIRHDALRSLRIVRLRASIDGQYHPDTYRALAKEIAAVRVLSGTRILEELEKMLCLQNPQRALEDLWELGILKEIIPELYACKGIAQPKDFHNEGDVWDHLLKCTTHFTEDHGKDVRLAALFHDCGKAQTFALKDRIRFDHHAEESADLAVKVLKRLQMPKARTDKIHWLIAHHMMMGTFKTLSDVRKVHWYFHPWFKELLQIFYLDITGTEPQDFRLYENIISDYDEFLNSHPRPEKPLLSGDEVMKILGLKPGEAVGEALQELHNAQVNKTVTTKAEARVFLKNLKMTDS